MISARRAALLGLTAPLSAIMVAVLGLWPESEEPPIDLPPPRHGGPDAAPASSRSRDRDFEEELEDRRDRERERHDQAEEDEMFQLALALITSGVLECH